MDIRTETTDLAAQLERRRAAAAAAWQLDEQIVLIGAGEPLPRPGRGDLAYPYEPHSEYYYLTDDSRPRSVLAFDPSEGWVHFLAPVTDAERLWSGVEEIAHDGPSVDQLEGWLARRSTRPLAWLGCPPGQAAFDAKLAADLRLELSRVRRPKDAIELERMRVAADATRAAFAAAVGKIEDGVTEREVQIELEAAAFRNDAEAMAFETIVGSGPRSAVLHIAPGARRMRRGELVLIDAGAEHLRYAGDVTRTYAVGGALDGAARELHEVVLAAQRAAIDACTPGIEWRDVHVAAGLAIAEGLVSFGLLRGEPETLVHSGAVWLFFPHGIGHLLGLGVRDAGDPLPERRDSEKPYPNLRIDLPLEPGFVVTVEPGLYFVPNLLEDEQARREHRDTVAWELVDKMLSFGGIRIEDDVLISDDGHEVLTGAVPLLG